MFDYSLYKLLKLLFSLIFLFSAFVVFAQVTVDGPNCVTTGLVYQYNIHGEWKGNDKISVCVEGGMLAESQTSCIEVQNLSYVKVQWSEGKTTGKITLTSNTGASNLSVNIVTPFKPGFIENAGRQILPSNKIPASISCTDASGGNCSPSYYYQWEQSFDRNHWSELLGATQSNLSFIAPLTKTTFFRRKAFESKSHTMGYTNQVAIFIIPQAKKN